MNDAQELILPGGDVVSDERAAMTTEQLDASNEQRLQRLVTGGLGMAIQIQPGLFENMRTMTYLDAIIDHLGVGDAARRKYSETAANVLDMFEAQVRMQVIQTGGTGQPIDLGTVQKLNREQRRHPPRVEPDGV